MAIEEVEREMDEMSNAVTPEQRARREKLLETWRLLRVVTVAHATHCPVEEDLAKLRELGVDVRFVRPVATAPLNT